MEYTWVFPLNLYDVTALGVGVIYTLISCKFSNIFLHTDPENNILAEKRILGLQVFFFIVHRRYITII